MKPQEKPKQDTYIASYTTNPAQKATGAKAVKAINQTTAKTAGASITAIAILKQKKN